MQTHACTHTHTWIYMHNAIKMHYQQQVRLDIATASLHLFPVVHHNPFFALFLLSSLQVPPHLDAPPRQNPGQHCCLEAVTLHPCSRLLKILCCCWPCCLLPTQAGAFHGCCAQCPPNRRPLPQHHRAAGLWCPLPTGSCYCQPAHLHGGRSGDAAPGPQACRWLWQLQQLWQLHYPGCPRGSLAHSRARSHHAESSHVLSSPRPPPAPCPTHC